MLSHPVRRWLASGPAAGWTAGRWRADGQGAVLQPATGWHVLHRGCSTQVDTAGRPPQAACCRAGTAGRRAVSGGDAAAACGRPPSRAHAQDCESVKLPGCQPGVPRLQAAAFWGGQSKPAVAVGPVELTIEFGDCWQPPTRLQRPAGPAGAASPNAAPQCTQKCRLRLNSPRSFLIPPDSLL